jgi:exopolyphosphatase/guanosine-5'-triphosphate,3'-diphosphate pyrophosphatase
MHDAAVLSGTPSQPEAVAAVDLGSNSFHLIVARHQGGELVVVDRLREMVQLASGLTASRRIDARSRKRALDCLQRFGQRLHHVPRHGVRAVGTNTLRIARNAADFLAQAEVALGHPIETISGMEEARLIYLGVAHSLANPASRRLVVDVGGGSTELIVGEQFQPIRMDSLYLGCVTLSRAAFPDGEIDSARWRRAELLALQEFEPVQASYRGLHWEEAVGASGTVRSIHAVVEAAGWSKEGITPKALERVRDALLRAGHVDRLRLTGVSPERRTVFPGGVALVMAAFESLGIERMRQAEGALREGLLHDLVGRIRAEDVRSRSVAALAERYHVDGAQAARVEQTALRLLSRVAATWDLTDREPRQLLAWAAQLHEIGLDIAHQHYHKHGEYVVAQSDLAGFSREEQRLLATLVRAHRRKFPVAVLAQLPRPRAREIERLAILLRLAVVLHRSRGPERIPDPTLEAGKRSLQLRFPGSWLAGKPLTRADLEQEQAYLEAGGFRLGFE